MATHPSLDLATGRFAVTGRPTSAGPDTSPRPPSSSQPPTDGRDHRPATVRWHRIDAPADGHGPLVAPRPGADPDVDLTGPLLERPTDLDLLHAVIGTAPEEATNRIGLLVDHWRSVGVDRFLALSFAAVGPDGDVGRLQRELLDATGGRAVLEHLRVHDPEPATGCWVTMVVRRLR